MKQRNNMLFAAALLSFSLTAAGQTAKKDSTLNRVVVVEKEYNPDIMDASKVNVLPKVQEPSVSKKEIEYNTSVMPFKSLDYVMKPITSNLDQAKANRGYARLGYGNNGNVDAKVNYLFNISKRDNLGVSASLDGMNATLKLPEIFETTYANRDWKSRYYRTNLDVDYQHKFDNMIFDATLNLGSDNFNYHPFLDATKAFFHQSTDKQHFSKWGMHVGIKSVDKDLPLQFQAEANLISSKLAYPDSASLSETILRTKGGVYGIIDENQSVGINAEMNNVFNKSLGYKNYTSLELNPYYGFSNDSWKLRLGAHVDYSSGKGKTIQFSPDLDAQYFFSNSYVAYLKVGGGRELNDLRRIMNMNPYAYFSQVNDSYNQLDATLGLKANVGSGFWFNAFAGYKIVTDDLNFNNMMINYFDVAKSYISVDDTKHFYIGSNLKYDYKGIVDLSLKGVYYSWRNSDASYLLMKPKFDLQFNADIKVLPELMINVGYTYVGRNDVISDFFIFPKLSASDFAVIGSSVPTTVMSVKRKLDPVNNLSLGATYNLFKGVSIFARINNVLNQDYQYSYSYPVQGINFLGGLSFQF